jgi:hypothetical protein
VLLQIIHIRCARKVQIILIPYSRSAPKAKTCFIACKSPESPESYLAQTQQVCHQPQVTVDLVIQGMEANLEFFLRFYMYAVRSFWTLVEVTRFPNLLSFPTFNVGSELRPLPSTGITQLPR